MQTAMIRDAVSRAVIEKEMCNEGQLTATQFSVGCQSVLTDKIDQQWRFRELVARQKGAVLETIL